MTPATAVARFSGTMLPAFVWAVYLAGSVLAGFAALAWMLLRFTD